MNETKFMPSVSASIACHDRSTRPSELQDQIYFGSRFKNDTERLEKLFGIFTKMTAANPSKRKAGVT